MDASLCPSQSLRHRAGKLTMPLGAALLSVLFTSTQSKADYLVGGHYACLTKDLLHEINVAEGSQKEWLLQNGCVVTRGGIEVHDLGFDGFGIKKVRILMDEGTPVLLWTAMENVR
jgi:hypothetical protein